MLTHCRNCGFPLTAAEAQYYTTQCEGCVQDDVERIAKWRAGGHDPALDERYGGNSPKIN